MPVFDTGGTASAYDVIILAMPPKDIMKFFNNDKRDAQSQADLHRRTNKGRKTVRYTFKKDVSIQTNKQTN